MEMKKKKESAKEMFLKGETEVKKLAKIFDVAEKTIRSWIKKGNWLNSLDELQTLDEEIKISVKRALVKSLKAYTKNPENTALQSLVSMLKQYYKTIEPSKEFMQYLKKFLDWQIDYYLSKGDETTSREIQKCILGEDDLVEYFKKRAES
jgi:predicted transcriptional regulator